MTKQAFTCLRSSLSFPGACLSLCSSAHTFSEFVKFKCDPFPIPADSNLPIFLSATTQSFGVQSLATIKSRKLTCQRNTIPMAFPSSWELLFSSVQLLPLISLVGKGKPVPIYPGSPTLVSSLHLPELDLGLGSSCLCLPPLSLNTQTVSYDGCRVTSCFPNWAPAQLLGWAELTFSAPVDQRCPQSNVRNAGCHNYNESWEMP